MIRSLASDTFNFSNPNSKLRGGGEMDYEWWYFSELRGEYFTFMASGHVATAAANVGISDRLSKWHAPCWSEGDWFCEGHLDGFTFTIQKYTLFHLSLWSTPWYNKRAGYREMLLPVFCLSIVKFSVKMICLWFTLRATRELCYFLQAMKQVKSLLLCSLTRKLSISLLLFGLYGMNVTFAFWNAPCKSANITGKTMYFIVYTRRDDNGQDQSLRSDHTQSYQTEPNSCFFPCSCKWLLFEAFMSDAVNFTPTGPKQG